MTATAQTIETKFSRIASRLGFTFTIQQREDGTPFVHVTDRWSQPEPEQAVGHEGITLRLKPSTTYSEAREIANYLNNKILFTNMPALELQA